MGSEGPVPVELRILEDSDAKQELLVRIVNYQDIPATLRGPEGEGILKEGCLTLKVPSVEFSSWKLYKECLEAKDAPRMLASGPMGESHVVEWSDRMLGLIHIAEKHRMPLMIMTVEFALFKRMARFVYAIGDSCKKSHTNLGPTELTHTLSGFGYDRSGPRGCLDVTTQWLEVAVRLDLDPDLIGYFSAILGFYSTMTWSPSLDGGAELPFSKCIIDRTVPLLTRYADESPDAVATLTGSIKTWHTLREDESEDLGGDLVDLLAEALHDWGADSSE